METDAGIHGTDREEVQVGASDKNEVAHYDSV